jgi:hemerythrin-like metal-binding protein
MSLLSWKHEHSVGIRCFDDEHKKLFSMINELHDAMRMGRGQEVTKKLLTSLGDYTVRHFAAEEASMSRTGFSGLAAHKAEHQKLVDDLKKIKSDLDAGRPVNSVMLLSFLKDWLTGHIMKCDKLYSTHLNAQGIQ